jgi:two-component sensor histidine kinase
MNNGELHKILLNPDYAKSLGIIVHVEVEENGDRYAILNNGKDIIKIRL